MPHFLYNLCKCTDSLCIFTGLFFFFYIFTKFIFIRSIICCSGFLQPSITHSCHYMFTIWHVRNRYQLSFQTIAVCISHHSKSFKRLANYNGKWATAYRTGENCPSLYFTKDYDWYYGNHCNSIRSIPTYGCCHGICTVKMYNANVISLQEEAPPLLMLSMLMCPCIKTIYCDHNNCNIQATNMSRFTCWNFKLTCWELWSSHYETSQTESLYQVS